MTIDLSDVPDGQSVSGILTQVGGTVTSRGDVKISQTAGAADAVRDGFQKLSAREREILALFLSGLNDRAVAERLTLSERTVQGHRAKIYAKFGLHTAKELEAILHELEPLLREAPL